jgi:hypothetical protein
MNAFIICHAGPDPAFSDFLLHGFGLTGGIIPL